MIVNITISIFINHSNKRYYLYIYYYIYKYILFETKRIVLRILITFSKQTFFCICCTHVHIYSEAARGLIPPPRARVKLASRERRERK